MGLHLPNEVVRLPFSRLALVTRMARNRNPTEEGKRRMRFLITILRRDRVRQLDLSRECLLVRVKLACGSTEANGRTGAKLGQSGEGLRQPAITLNLFGKSYTWKSRQSRLRSNLQPDCRCSVYRVLLGTEAAESSVRFRPFFFQGLSLPALTAIAFFLGYRAR